MLAFQAISALTFGIAIISSLGEFVQDYAMPLGTGVVAIFLGLWQWYDKRARRKDGDSVDVLFFENQDRRRWIGIGMMLLLAVVIAIVDPSQMSKDPHSLRQLAQLANLFFLVVLVLGLLALASFDAMATLRYARRQRRELAQEHAKLMLEVIRRSGSTDVRRLAEKKGEAPRI